MLLNYNTEWELQVAILKQLTGDEMLMTLLKGGVLDHVPATAPEGGQTLTPYIVIGEGTTNEWDTKTEVGEEITVMLHIWSSYPGRREVKILQGHLKRLLHDQLLDVEGHTTVVARREFADTSLDPDGATMHGVVRYRYILQSI